MRFPKTDITRLIAEALGRHKARSPIDHPDRSVQARHLEEGLGTLSEHGNTYHNPDFAEDSAVVKLTGAQTVAGVKTFSSIPVLPASDPTTDYQAANKKYVDDNAGGGGGGHVIEDEGVPLAARDNLNVIGYYAQAVDNDPDTDLLIGGQTFNAIVDGVGTQPNHYATLAAAVAAVGVESIWVASDCSGEGLVTVAAANDTKLIASDFNLCPDITADKWDVTFEGLTFTDKTLTFGAGVRTKVNACIFYGVAARAGITTLGTGTKGIIRGCVFEGQPAGGGANDHINVTGVPYIIVGCYFGTSSGRSHIYMNSNSTVLLGDSYFEASSQAYSVYCLGDLHAANCQFYVKASQTNGVYLGGYYSTVVACKVNVLGAVAGIRLNKILNIISGCAIAITTTGGTGVDIDATACSVTGSMLGASKVATLIDIANVPGTVVAGNIFVTMGDVTPVAIAMAGASGANSRISTCTFTSIMLGILPIPIVTGSTVDTVMMGCYGHGDRGPRSQMLFNRSGGALVQGDVVIIDAANDWSFTTTAVANNNDVLGVVLDTSIADDAEGAIAIGGVARVKVNGAVARADIIVTNSTATEGLVNNAPGSGVILAKALATKAAGVGLVECIILGGA